MLPALAERADLAIRERQPLPAEERAGERVRRDWRIEIHQQPAPIGAGALQHRADLALRQSREQTIFRRQTGQILVDIIYPQQALRYRDGKLIVNVTIKPLREKARVIAAEAPADAPQRIAERAVLQRRQRRNDLSPERKRQRRVPLRAMLPARQLVRKVERKQDADTVRAFRLVSAPHILRLATCLRFLRHSKEKQHAAQQLPRGGSRHGAAFIRGVKRDLPHEQRGELFLPQPLLGVRQGGRQFIRHRPPPFPRAQSAASRGHRDRRCGPRSHLPSRCIAAPARRAARRRRDVRRTRP